MTDRVLRPRKTSHPNFDPDWFDVLPTDSSPLSTPIKRKRRSRNSDYFKTPTQLRHERMAREKRRKSLSDSTSPFLHSPATADSPMSTPTSSSPSFSAVLSPLRPRVTPSSPSLQGLGGVGGSTGSPPLIPSSRGDHAALHGLLTAAQSSASALLERLAEAEEDVKVAFDEQRRLEAALAEQTALVEAERREAEGLRTQLRRLQRLHLKKEADYVEALGETEARMREEYEKHLKGSKRAMEELKPQHSVEETGVVNERTVESEQPTAPMETESNGAMENRGKGKEGEAEAVQEEGQEAGKENAPPDSREIPEGPAVECGV